MGIFLNTISIFPEGSVPQLAPLSMQGTSQWGAKLCPTGHPERVGLRDPINGGRGFAIRNLLGKPGQQRRADCGRRRFGRRRYEWRDLFGNEPGSHGAQRGRLDCALSLADNALGSPTVLTLDGLGGLYGLTPGCNSTAGAYIPISPVLECAVKL